MFQCLYVWIFFFFLRIYIFFFKFHNFIIQVKCINSSIFFLSPSWILFFFSSASYPVAPCPSYVSWPSSSSSYFFHHCHDLWLSTNAMQVPCFSSCHPNSLMKPEWLYIFPRSQSQKVAEQRVKPLNYFWILATESQESGPTHYLILFYPLLLGNWVFEDSRAKTQCQSKTAIE